MQIVSIHDTYMISESPQCYYLIMFIPCLICPGIINKAWVIFNIFAHFSGHNLQDCLGYNLIGSLHVYVFTLYRRSQNLSNVLKNSVCSSYWWVREIMFQQSTGKRVWLVVCHVSQSATFCESNCFLASYIAEMTDFCKRCCQFSTFVASFSNIFFTFSGD